MDLKMQKRVAADILEVGKNKVWIDPERKAEVSTAITREDVRQLVEEDAIRAKKRESSSKGRARNRKNQKEKGRQSGPGSRKGAKEARKKKKDEWKDKVRALRARLRDLRDEEVIDRSTYRELYKKVKGGAFRSKSHLNTYLKEDGVLEE
ncbi:50S ribosomal protein L19 [candidate division MSBL1 archaeon SCGC-AAA382C18]|uniref:Large ribosomal subunit protein eL19 n=1 Tax=candidate division MSBL1 archaeon SCGC-AAA382C18 TaxID=1698281 RepID=A0A133VJF3_9EURY|nr:50S ribosomal protein L19 [candidate division MSBL1 archaeon SCGC-AAA382C18]